jgi:hypothetical protein
MSASFSLRGIWRVLLVHQLPRLLLLCASVVLFIACASNAPQDTASAQGTARDCERTTGSNMCRRSGGSTASPSTTISGEEWRRQGEVGSVTTPRSTPQQGQN